VVIYRAFGREAEFNPGGEVAAAVADLAEPEPRWSAAALAANGGLNVDLAADLSPVDGGTLVFWEHRDSARAEGEPVMHGVPQRWEPDLAVAAPGLSFSRSEPRPGEGVEVTVWVVNRGLKPVENAEVGVEFHDADPAGGSAPFARVTLRGPLGLGEKVPVTATYLPRDRAVRRFHVRIDTAQAVAESDETNNGATAAWGGMAAPVDLDAVLVGDGSGVRVTWVPSAEDGSVRHWLWRTLVRTGESELLGATHGGEWMDRGVLPGEAYRYRVLARDAGGVSAEAGIETAVEVPVPAALDPESLRLNAVLFRGRLVLSWAFLPAVQLQETEG